MFSNVVNEKMKIILVSLLFFTVCTVWLGSKFEDRNIGNLLQYNLKINDIFEKSSLIHNGEINSNISSSEIRITKVNSSDFQIPQTSKTFNNVPDKLTVSSYGVPIAKIIDSCPHQTGYGPENAIDGAPRTFWNTAIPNGKNYNDWYITFELSERYTVYGVNLINYGDHTHDVTKFKLESSDDKATWHIGGSISDVVTGSHKWQNFYGLTATGKYLRFTVTQTYDGWQPWLCEISFNGYLESFHNLKKSNLNSNTIFQRINKSNENTERIKISDETIKGINKSNQTSKKVIEESFGITLDLDEILLPASDMTWPVVVMSNNGRTGNCFNSYAISLALKKEFGDNATISVMNHVFDKVAKVVDIQGLSLPIVENTFINRAREMGIAVGPPNKFMVSKNLVAHIQPSIQNEITNFKNTQKKKVLILAGYPNRMYMIADFQDEIRRSFHIKSNLLTEAQTFLHKVSDGRGSNLVFVGFHIRRTDYIQHSKKYNGVSVPGPKYYSDALAHYRLRFDNVLFVVASDDLKHAKDNLQQHQDVVFTEMTPEKDMALLASCNHSIMTVGSFGWWSSFLAGGDVVYALLFNYTVPPFAHPEMLGPHGFENFHGVPVL